MHFLILLLNRGSIKPLNEELIPGRNNREASITLEAIYHFFSQMLLHGEGNSPVSVPSVVKLARCVKNNPECLQE